MSVDAEARARALVLLEDFAAARISNDDLEDRWPASEDLALGEIARAVWLTYDDLEEQYGPSADFGLIGRCTAFLRANEPWSWPAPTAWQRLLGACVGVLTLGAVQLSLAGPRLDPPWPFINEPPTDLPRADVTG